MSKQLCNSKQLLQDRLWAPLVSSVGVSLRSGSYSFELGPWKSWRSGMRCLVPVRSAVSLAPSSLLGPGILMGDLDS
jgi:hypothetical protein